jgi:hypothetical protein
VEESLADGAGVRYQGNPVSDRRPAGARVFVIGKDGPELSVAVDTVEATSTYR